MMNLTRRLPLLLLATAADLGVWGVAGLFGASEFYRRVIVLGGAPTQWDQVIEVQMCTSLIWAAMTPLVVLIAQHLPLRPPHRIRNLVAIIVFIPYLAVFRAGLGGVVLNLAEHQPISPEMVSLSIGIRTHRDVAILAVIFFVYNLVDAQREASERQRRSARAQTLLARAEIDELRRRLQPRFAVRMLRHIGGALRERPEAGDGLIVGLSGILRRSMSRETEARIPLADELEHLDRCLELCRAGGRVSVAARYVASDEVLACRVPALVLEPVIEAVVLDLTAGDGGSVEVRCARDADEAHIEICSTAAAGVTVDAHEQGAAVMRARLDELYGDTACVFVVRKGQSIQTTMIIPYSEAAA